MRLTAKAATAEEAERIIAPVADEVVRRLGDTVFSTDDESLEQAVAGCCANGAARSRRRSRSRAAAWPSG